MSKTNTVAVEIGEVIRKARVDQGFKSRKQLTDTRKLKKKIGPEGLRKIEAGERVPKIENLQLIGEALGLGPRKIKELETMALKVGVERATRKAGNVDATVTIRGRPVHITSLPPKRKAEDYARRSTNDLIELGDRLGWFANPQDKEYFRRYSRAILLKNMNQETT